SRRWGRGRRRARWSNRAGRINQAGSWYRDRRRGVVDAELHPGAAVPVVGAQMAGEVEEGAAAVEQGGAERVVEAAEGDRLEPAGAGGIADRAADMGAADRFGEEDAGGRKGEARLGVAGAERRQLLDEREELGGRRALRDGAVDGQPRHRHLGADRRLDARGEEVAQRADLAFLDGEAGRHGVAAAVDQ